MEKGERPIIRGRCPFGTLTCISHTSSGWSGPSDLRTVAVDARGSFRKRMRSLPQAEEKGEFQRFEPSHEGATDASKHSVTS